MMYPLIYWLDLFGNLYEYNNTTDTTIKHFSQAIDSISKFQDVILALAFDNTLYISGKINQTVVNFIGQDNILFRQGESVISSFVPIYTNIDMIASDNNKIVMSVSNLK